MVLRRYDLGCLAHASYLIADEHFHADFIAGHLELRDRTRAVIHLGSRAVAEYPLLHLLV
jgi:hydroxyacylglutathione hydrolase